VPWVQILSESEEDLLCVSVTQIANPRTQLDDVIHGREGLLVSITELFTECSPLCNYN
jgi:hypothetical protein